MSGACTSGYNKPTCKWFYQYSCQRRNLPGDGDKGASTALVISRPQERFQPITSVESNQETAYKCPKSVSNKVRNCNDIESMCKVDLVRQ